MQATASTTVRMFLETPMGITVFQKDDGLSWCNGTGQSWEEAGRGSPHLMETVMVQS